MAKSPAFGRGVRPELMLADFSPIVAGGQAMGAGLASVGQSIGGAFKERGELKKTVAAAESSMKALANQPDLDPQIRSVVESTQQQLASPDLSLKQQAGIAEGANQTLTRALQLGAYQLQQEEAQANRLFQQNQQDFQQTKFQADQAYRDADLALRRDTMQGQQDARNRGLDIQQQQADQTGAYREGMLEQGARELDIKEKAAEPPKFGVETDPLTGARFVTFGNSIQQVRLPQGEITSLEKDLAAIDRQRLAGGMQPLSQEEKLKALEIYATKKAQGSSSENAMQQVMAQLIAKNTGIDYQPGAQGPQNMFGAGAPAPAPQAPAAKPVTGADIVKEFGF